MLPLHELPPTPPPPRSACASDAEHALARARYARDLHQYNERRKTDRAIAIVFTVIPVGMFVAAFAAFLVAAFGLKAMLWPASLAGLAWVAVLLVRSLL